MKRFVLTFLSLLVCPIVGYAQQPVACPTTANSDPQFSQSGSGTVFGRTAAQHNQYFKSKVDANNGVMCNPTIGGGFNVDSGTFTNGLVAKSGTVTNLPSPVNGGDAANKTYVDNKITGVVPQQSVVWATTGPLPNSPGYNNGSAGVGATLQAGVNNVPLVIDGGTVNLNDRVLVKDEVNTTHNGVYYLSQTSSASLPWKLTRVLDWDTSAQMVPNSNFIVTAGTMNISTGWFFSCPNPCAVTVGVSNIVFQLSQRSQVYNADHIGVNLTGNVFSLNKYTTNGAVQAIASPPVGTQIVRTGFNQAGDSPATTYTFSSSTCPLNGGAGDNGSQIAVTGGGCFLANFTDGANLLSFGASTSSSDNSAAIQAWANQACTTKLTAPPGTFNFRTAPIIFPLCSNGVINAGGIYGTLLTYTGTATTPDILVFGDRTYTTQISGWSVKGLMVNSATQMTAGSAIHLADIVASVFDQSNAGGQYAPPNGPNLPVVAPKLWNGVWCDFCFDVWYTNSEASGQNDAARASGKINQPMAGFYLVNDKLSNSVVGLHIGGNTGAVDPVNANIIANATNVLVDQGIVAVGNYASVFDSATAIDTSTTGPGILINDPGFQSNQVMVFNGTWNCTNHTYGMWVQNINGQKIIANFSALCNNALDGLRVDDANAIITDNNGPGIYINGGFGINASVPTSHLYLNGQPLSNSSGPYNANAKLGSNTNPGQTSCGAGAFCYTKDFAGNIHEFFNASFTGASATILNDTITYPLAFPNLVLINTFSCSPEGFSNGASQMTVGLIGASNSQVTVQLVSSSAVGVPQPVFCQVWGY